MVCPAGIRFPLIAGLCVAAGTAGAFAQTTLTFRDQVVVTATGDEEPVSDVCAAITVVDRATIRASGRSSVADLLRGRAGISVARTGGVGGTTSVFVRGANAAQTLVLYDGVRLNSPFFGGYDWSMPLTAGLARIEIARGPYSALYGGDALAGVIQLIPERPTATRARVFAEAGGSGWRRADLDAAVASGRWGATVVAADRSGSGPLANDDFSGRAAMVDLGYALDEGGRIGVLVRRTTSRTEIPFSGADLTPHRSTSAEEVQASVPLTFVLADGSRLEASVSRVERTLRYRDPNDPSGFVASDTAANSTGVELRWHRSLGGHRLIFGGEWRRDVVTDGSSFGTNLAGRSLVTGGAFVQDSIALAGDLAATVGVRLDRTSSWGSELSPRATVSWSPGRVRLWAAAGRAFRAPGLGELYYPYSGNPDLEPERARDVEIGIRTGGAAQSLEVVAFRNRIANLIDFEFATFSFANVGRAAQDGVELSWSRALGRGRLDADVTWLDARDGTGLRLLRRPEWSGSVTARTPFGAGAEAFAALVWVGPRPDLDPVSLVRVDQPGFLTASAAVALQLRPGVRLRVRGENLANRRYQEVRGYPATGRRAMIGIETAWR